MVEKNGEPTTPKGTVGFPFLRLVGFHGNHGDRPLSRLLNAAVASHRRRSESSPASAKLPEAKQTSAENMRLDKGETEPSGSIWLCR